MGIEIDAVVDVWDRKVGAAGGETFDLCFLECLS